MQAAKGALKKALPGVAELSKIPTVVLVKVWIHGSLPLSRVSQKTLKRREPQRHEDTKFFLCLSGLRSAGKKSLPLCLCAFVVQGLLPFATPSTEGVAKAESPRPSSWRRRLVGWFDLLRNLKGRNSLRSTDPHLRRDDDWWGDLTFTEI